MIVTPNEDDVLRALVAFLVNVLPDGVPIINGQDNRVPEPTEPDFVEITPLRLPRLSTTFEALTSLGLQASYTQAAQGVFQLDIHGPNSFNNASIISTMFRSSYGADFFANIGPAISPLFADDPRQMPFNDGEQQYEDRYIVEANLQVNLTVTATTQSARALEVGIVDIDTDPTTWPNSVVSAP